MNEPPRLKAPKTPESRGTHSERAHSLARIHHHLLSLASLSKLIRPQPRPIRHPISHI
ncbi:hypothetical protein PSTG_19808 [Puccinia striiformis f. sp. tritici PST-78]|uniref:Uncharacterized protein n=1 Tax=Puccinia striiformis f. sp. tritici PST-78 TaxID=1165861 RepID=A0A0L0UIQ1_9BASI|nr:hypothetical protein PSTG_19808 [Puccinia striiformis f. sp. tritici PST-78]